ncbi:MAG TPA: response regulator transcription factor [Bacteroidales bacterium]|nr:response regulator transcription factor [Bacteroidales bacterium]
MAKSNGKILLIEDDKNLGFIIRDFLELSKYHVILRDNGKDGLLEYSRNHFDLLLVDIMLPLLDGFALVEEIRKKNAEVPVIFITAKSMTEDKIKGFNIGADDYITKPFSTEELLLRVNAMLRRIRRRIPDQNEEIKYKIGKYIFDYKNLLLSTPDTEYRLTKREAEVLSLLCMNVNNVSRREVILKTVWGENDYFMGRSMDVYITKLRKYLKEDPSVSIINIHNTGFMLEVKN